MKAGDAWAEDQGAGTEADLAVVADLRLRLQGSQEQLLATRREARRLARELAIARRLLKFTSGNPPPPRVRPPLVAAPPVSAEAEIPRQRATLLTEPVIYHLDACESRGRSTTISGWAFRPAPEWDARATTVTLLFRHGATVYYATAGRVPRVDVAAHFAAQPVSLFGGARGLDSTGFTCEVRHDSLPAGMDLEIVLRLEMRGLGVRTTHRNAVASLIRGNAFATAHAFATDFSAATAPARGRGPEQPASRRRERRHQAFFCSKPCSGWAGNSARRCNFST